MILALVLGTLLAVASWPWLDSAARWMGADAGIGEGAVAYLRIRLLGGPATLVMIAAFGALRGLEDMRTPLRVALASNGLNCLLDPILIFGWGPVPASGIAGAAWASTASQWLAAVWAFLAVHQRLGLASQLRWRRALRLLRVGRDLVARTGLLLLFLLLATRVATQIGAQAGAAHQVVRQVWLLAALALDALAVSAQSLIGYFLGAQDIARARQVARVACQWGLATGALLTLAMLALAGTLSAWLDSPAARELFLAAWLVSALAQPLSALAFVTDGVHWGTADYAYLRNGMLVSTSLGLLALLGIDPRTASALTQVWVATAGWLAVRTAFGLVRIWPGVGRSPLRAT
jgi:MATE family multidrug resistance protein